MSYNQNKYFILNLHAAELYLQKFLFRLNHKGKVPNNTKTDFFETKSS